MPNIGPLEIAIVLVIVLLIFGPKRLPDLGRSMGRGMREFKDSITGKDDDNDSIESGDTVTSASSDEERKAAAKPADVS
jgi:sec-independent protein translocase protein TatA